MGSKKKREERVKRQEWIIDLQSEWEATNSSREFEIKQRKCIYKVPDYFMNIRRDSYSPQIVSLGPYHHGDKCLKGMERIKRKILGAYLGKIGVGLDDVLEAMGREVGELMDAYDDLEEPWTNVDRFAQLMVVDGCFLLGLLLFQCNMVEDRHLRSCFEDLAPVISTVNMDIKLLENQIPRRALEILVEVGEDKVPTNINVSRLLIKNEVDDNLLYNFDSMEFEHKLHAVWVSRRVGNDFLFKSTWERDVNLPTITELVEAGVQIERSSSMSISFEKGVLKLPQIIFIDDIRCLYHNLLAFEKMHNLDPEFFSFVDFIDCLIDTAKDAEILRRKGIVSGGMACDQDVADFFNWITRRVYPLERKWRMTGNDISKPLADYCKRWQNRWYASFQRLYLANPWAFISLLGAILLLALTVLATVYAMLQYYKPLYV